MSRLAHPASESAEGGALSHQGIWDALDALAARHGMSPSGLAKRAGLDATTFNRSKRRTSDGRLRWPSTESIAKVLDATGASLAEFFGFEELRQQPSLRRISMDLLRKNPGSVDAHGQPAGEGWREEHAPDLTDRVAFAVEISDDQLAPLLRQGDLVAVAPNARARQGDRVLVKPHDEPAVFAEFVGREGRRIDLRRLDPSATAFSLDSVDWIGPVLWVGR